jgi:hypothetical protein
MTVAQLRLQVISAAQMPSVAPDTHARGRARWPQRRRLVADVVRLSLLGCTAFLVVFVYIGVPIALLAGERLNSLMHAVLLAAAAIALGASLILCILHSTNLDVDRGGRGRNASEPTFRPHARRAMPISARPGRRSSLVLHRTARRAM